MKSAANWPNDTYNFRPSPSGSRTIWSECGIDVSELVTTEIPRTIWLHRWGNFVSSRPPYHPEIVRDFYAALIPEVYKESSTVMLHGCKVVTAEKINKYFRTRDIPNNSIFGLSRQEFFAKVDPRFASELRWDESNKSRDLLYEELHPEMALWTMFINHNLIPSKPLIKKTILSLEMAQLLFSIKMCLPIDIGHIIHRQIGDANNSASSLLPFPSLITHFCGKAGVTISENLCPPMADIGWESYNGFAQSQGLPTLASRKQGRGRVPVLVQSQHGNNADRPKWVNEITGRLDSLSEMMVGQFNSLSAQINHLGMRVTSLEDAMRDAGFEHLDSSRRVRLRPTE